MASEETADARGLTPMRFKISDLLFATTLGAIYAAGFSVTRGGDSSPTPLSSLALLLMMPVSMLGIAWSTQWRLGKVIASWRIGRWWFAHLLLVGIFAMVALWCYTTGTTVSLRAAGLTMTYHILFLTMTPIAIGENGVLSSNQLLTWRQYQFYIDAEARRLVYKRREETAAIWKPAGGEPPIPDREYEKVTEFLVAESGPERETMDDHG